jgi:hypothetical protein
MTARIHVAGEVHADGSQRCLECGLQLIGPDCDAVCDRFASRPVWGFPFGRRVVEPAASAASGLPSFYLMSPDRHLAPGEEPCR